MIATDVKSALKKSLHEYLGVKASDIFQNRAYKVLEESLDDKESLEAAAERIGKMIALFIDKQLSKTITESLKEQIRTSM